MRVQTPREFRQALGHRAQLHPPTGQWAGGPFYLDVSLANGAVTAVDLTQHDPWYGDPQVRQAYALTDGSSTRIKATLHLEAVGIMLIDGATVKLDVDTMEKLFQSTTAPYLTVTVGTTTRKIPLGAAGAIWHAMQLVQVTQAAAADGERAKLQGKMHVLPSPIRIDLENDAFTLNTDVDVALGAAEACKLVLAGCLWPGSVGIPGSIPGMGCEADGDGGLSVADIRGQNIQSIGVYRPFGV